LKGTPLEEEMVKKDLITPYDRKGYFIHDPNVQLLDSLVDPIRKKVNRDLDRIIFYQFQYARAYARRLEQNEESEKYLNQSRENLWWACEAIRQSILKWYRNVIKRIELNDLSCMSLLMADFITAHNDVLNQYAEETLLLAMDTGLQLPSSHNDFFPTPPREWISLFRAQVEIIEPQGDLKRGHAKQ